MKKLLFCVLSALCLAGCSSDDEITGGIGDKKTEPSTEVYVQGQSLKAKTLRATMAQSEVKAEQAYFYIRIDNRIPEMGNCPSELYWPQEPNGESTFQSGNEGLVDTAFPYYDTCDIYPFYVYDSKGEATLPAIVKAPELKDLLAANRNRRFDLSKINTDTLKVIWYVVKKSYGKIHVDGILTGKSTKDITEVPGVENEKDLVNKDDTRLDPESDGNVEVDIHQQEHKDWDEIKTTIHVREIVDSVKVTIPIGRDNMAEADDFAIRVYEYYYTINSKPATTPVTVRVEHQDDQMVITVVCTDKEYMEWLRETYKDGFTVEVHSYTKNLDKATVFEQLKKSTVWTAKKTNVIFKGATSAFFTE